MSHSKERSVHAVPKYVKTMGSLSVDCLFMYCIVRKYGQFGNFCFFLQTRCRYVCHFCVVVVSECLEYPDFSGIVLYRFVVSLVLFTDNNMIFPFSEFSLFCCFAV